MTTTFSYGGTTVAPVLVDGWAQARGSRNIAHDLIGGGVEITHTPPRPRAGTIRAVFRDEQTALQAEQLHVTAPYIDLASDDREIANGRYVVAEGDIGLELDDQTRDLWLLTVAFIEVTS